MVTRSLLRCQKAAGANLKQLSCPWRTIRRPLVSRPAAIPLAVPTQARAARRTARLAATTRSAATPSVIWILSAATWSGTSIAPVRTNSCRAPRAARRASSRGNRAPNFRRERLISPSAGSGYPERVCTILKSTASTVISRHLQSPQRPAISETNLPIGITTETRKAARTATRSSPSNSTAYLRTANGSK